MYRQCQAVRDLSAPTDHHLIIDVHQSGQAAVDGPIMSRRDNAHFFAPALSRKGIPPSDSRLAAKPPGSAGDLWRQRPQARHLLQDLASCPEP
jgi:hypothetical protein